ncbi:MAG: prolyl oligopeptidase family serine peptidase [Opitutaceae bacterium]|nr:prolyl oligopeptidase family serine peptidase [Opitutaceae bacterium]
MKLKTPLTLFLLGLAGALVASAAELQAVASFEKTITKKVGYHYLLALPTGYAAAKDKQWPLLVFLHGSGERGSDPWLVAKHGPPKLLRESPLSSAGKALAENFIVVSPQCPANTWWDDDAIGALLDEIAAKHRVDAKRTYLTGLSMGGFGTWSYAIKNPGRFAAIVPICGGGEPSMVRRMARVRRNELTTLGVWVFHGAKDPTVLLEESEKLVDALKKAAVTEVQFTIYPEAKHDSWTETYANPELYAWLLKHHR